MPHEPSGGIHFTEFLPQFYYGCTTVLMITTDKDKQWRHDMHGFPIKLIGPTQQLQISYFLKNIVLHYVLQIVTTKSNFFTRNA